MFGKNISKHASLSEGRTRYNYVYTFANSKGQRSLKECPAFKEKLLLGA